MSQRKCARLRGRLKTPEGSDDRRWEGKSEGLVSEAEREVSGGRANVEVVP